MIKKMKGWFAGWNGLMDTESTSMILMNAWWTDLGGGLDGWLNGWMDEECARWMDVWMNGWVYG